MNLQFQQNHLLDIIYHQHLYFHQPLHLHQNLLNPHLLLVDYYMKHLLHHLLQQYLQMMNYLLYFQLFQFFRLLYRLFVGVFGFELRSEPNFPISRYFQSQLPPRSFLLPVSLSFQRDSRLSSLPVHLSIRLRASQRL